MTKLLVRLFVKNNEDIQNQGVRQNYGVMGSIVGIICNLLLCTGKFLAGIFTSSIAVIADAFNNLSDAGSSIVSLIGFKMAAAPADEDHPFGHGRAEYVSGLIVSLIILLMGFELGKSSIEKIIHPAPTEFSILSLIIMIMAIVVKVWMSFFNLRLSKIIQSSTLKATAMDSLSDVIATSTVVICMLISYFTSFNLDAYAGVIVALFILYTGWQTAKETLNPLLGQAPDADFVEAIEKKVRSYPYILGIHDLIVHNYGPNYKLISLHAEVPCDGDILVIHDTIDLIERDIKRDFNCETVIHMDPIITNDTVTNAVQEKIAALVQLIDERITVHDFRMVEGPTHTNLIFDIVVPHRFRMSDIAVVEAIRKAVKTLDSTYEIVVNVDKAYVMK